MAFSGWTPNRCGDGSSPDQNSFDPERMEWQREVLRIFDRMKNEKSHYEIRCGGQMLTVFPNVYSPKYFTDSFWFAEELPKLVRGKTLLEIGTGVGIAAVFCARQGATVVATDINPEAVRNAQFNARLHHLNMSVREGNLYEPIESNERFDFIFWNHPFHNWSVPVTDVLLRASLDHNYECLKEYIRGAQVHLSENGKLLLGTGDHADLKTIAAVAGENSYSIKVLKEAELPLEEGGTVLNTYIICEFLKQGSPDRP
jgi:release factor glutamine methyltransferase